MKQAKPSARVRWVQFGWIILSCIPVINWIGFLWLGKTVERKRWSAIGYVHFVFSLALFGLFLVSLVNGKLVEAITSTSDVLQALAFFLSSWLVGVIQAWWIFGEANKRLKYKAAELDAAPPQDLPVLDTKTRRRSNLLFIWAAVIPLAGICPVRMGTLTKDEKLSKQGWATLIASVFLVAVLAYDFITPNTFYTLYLSNGDEIHTVINLALCFLMFIDWVYALRLCVKNKDAYHAAYAEEFTQYGNVKSQIARELEQNKQQYPCLKRAGWKFRHSIWMLWCLTPFTAPVALIHLGISERSWKQALLGVAGLAVSLGLVFYMRVLGETLFENDIALAFMLLIAIWGLVTAYGFTMVRAHLLYSARKGGGYCDAFEAEQAARQKAADQRDA